jgi:hypothetical protein
MTRSLGHVHVKCHHCEDHFIATDDHIIAHRVVLCRGGGGHSVPIVKCPRCGATTTLENR